MTEERKGEWLVFTGAFIWGWFPILAILSYKTVPNMVSLTVSTFLACIPFLCILLYRKKLYELKNKLVWQYVFCLAIFNSVIYYSLYYFGLTKTTPGNASIIALFEVFTSYVFFHMIKREHFSFESKIGSALMVLGAVIVLTPNFRTFNVGDAFILIATLFAPIGNMFQQKARLISSTETVVFLRSIIAAPILLAITNFFGQRFEISELRESWLFLVLSGFVILGLSRIFWVESISRLPVTKAVALSCLSPFFTLSIAWLILHQAPTIWQIASLIPFSFGVLLLTDNLKLRYAKRN